MAEKRDWMRHNTKIVGSDMLTDQDFVDDITLLSDEVELAQQILLVVEEQCTEENQERCLNKNVREVKQTHVLNHTMNAALCGTILSI